MVSGLLDILVDILYVVGKTIRVNKEKATGGRAGTLNLQWPLRKTQVKNYISDLACQGIFFDRRIRVNSLCSASGGNNHTEIFLLDIGELVIILKEYGWWGLIALVGVYLILKGQVSIRSRWFTYKYPRK